MKPTDGTAEISFFVNDPINVTAESEQMSNILDARYNKADLTGIVMKMETNSKK